MTTIRGAYKALVVALCQVKVRERMPRPGELLAKMREKLGISQREAARRSGLSAGTLNHMENAPGKIGANATTIEKLAKLYDRTPQQLE